ncbi:MAG: DNA polymerase IV [Alicyclobacillus sp.]|nr:DNA polymerase IV [Alicyclobacillus sp.]
MRAVLHVDMNAFYCACHAAAEPSRYAGRPTAVAGSPETRHGVVVTASYEARALGVRATMTVAEALRVAPQLTLIHPDFDLYRRISRQVFDVVLSYTPQVEIFSIDECWADVSGSGQFGQPRAIAEEIQQRLLQELGIPCSIGVSANKFLAKMASDLRKPLCVTELWPDEIEERLWPLPIEQMFGVGDKSAARLRRLSIRTIGQLAHADPALLRRHFGVRGERWRALAAGLDDSPVVAHPAAPKSIGHSITLSRDVADLAALETVLLNLSDQVGRRLRRRGLAGRTVQLTIRYASRRTVTRARTLAERTELTEDIYATARALLQEHLRPGAAVRLLGVAIGQLGEPGPSDGVQLSLFDTLEASAFQPGGAVPPSGARPVQVEKLRRLTDATDRLRDKFGEDIVIRGRMLTDPESGQVRNRRIRGTSLQKDWLQSSRGDGDRRG